MGSIENARVDEWGQRSVNNAQKELDQLNGQIAEVGVDAALTVCSSVPGAGIACDFASLGKSLYQGDWLGAALDLVGFVPVVGDAIKGSTRGAKVLKTMDDLTGALSVAQAVVNKSRRVLSQGTDAIRAAARSSGDFLGIRKAAARDYWSKQVRNSDAYQKYLKQIENCPDAACKAKARKAYEQERYKHMNLPKAGPPPAGRGEWVGNGAYPGSGIFKPHPDTELARSLDAYNSKYGTNFEGVKYSGGHPDFSPFVMRDSRGRPMEVEIQNMRGDRLGGDGDFGQARSRLSEKYGSWSKRQESGYTWHHKEDGTTMQLIDSTIHNAAAGGATHRGSGSMMSTNAAEF